MKRKITNSKCHLLPRWKKKRKRRRKEKGGEGGVTEAHHVPTTGHACVRRNTEENKSRLCTTRLRSLLWWNRNPVWADAPKEHSSGKWNAIFWEDQSKLTSKGSWEFSSDTSRKCTSTTNAMVSEAEESGPVVWVINQRISLINTINL